MKTYDAQKKNEPPHLVAVEEGLLFSHTQGLKSEDAFLLCMVGQAGSVGLDLLKPMAFGENGQGMGRLGVSDRHANTNDMIQICQHRQHLFRNKLDKSCSAVSVASLERVCSEE